MQGHGRLWKLPAQCVRGVSSDWLVDARLFDVNPSGKWGGSVELCRRWEPEDWSSSQETGCGGVLPCCATTDPSSSRSVKPVPCYSHGIATGILRAGTLSDAQHLLPLRGGTRIGDGIRL